MEEIKELWLNYNKYANKLSKALGRTNNIVGEYAEYLAHKYYGGRLLEISGASADIEALNGKLYQVKARKIKGTTSSQLSIIRSWDFDYLVVILFEPSGAIKQAIEVPVEIAQKYGAVNSHQNGWVITTSQSFLNNNDVIDLTGEFNFINQIRQEDKMDLHELAKILKEMYFNAADGETVAMIHLFGIKYASEIAASDCNSQEIALAAGISESYKTEIAKGVKLAKYVTIKNI